MDRRLAAIMAADVVGYSRLIRADEEGTLAALKALRGQLIDPILSKHNGRIVKLMGDGMLAEFPSVVDAVRAGIETQKAIAEYNSNTQSDNRFEFRVGINLGDIVIDGDDIQGDGVNVAARLEGLAQPGGVCISDGVYEQVRDRLDFQFEDLGEREVKNIARPLRIWQWLPLNTAVSIPKDTYSLISFIDKPSIAVLPFDNMSGDTEQEYFADGMTEDIITMLSGVPELFVIARNSTFAYKGKSPDVRDVAADLSVRYVLEGSVRKAGDRIRVTAQFIDAESGKHIWAERYDRVLEDIFAVQDEVAQGIVGALQSRLIGAEAKFLRRTSPSALDAWGNIVNAKLKLFAFRRADIDAAEPYARRAVEIDPDYAEGHAVLGHILAWRTWNGWSDNFKQTAKETLYHCRQALHLGSNDPSVLIDVGFSLWWLGRQDEAIPHLSRAADLNPNSPMTMVMYGHALCAQGQDDEGLELCKKAFRLSPKDPLEYVFLSLFGVGQFHAGKLLEAKATLERSLQINPDFTYSLVKLASVCVKLGQLEQAKNTLSRAEALSTTVVPFLFRVRPFSESWLEVIDPLREIYDGPLPMPEN